MKLENINDFIENMNKFYNQINKENDKYEVIYSITFHESSLCMLDTLLNILVYNAGYNVAIICSINHVLFGELNKIKLPPNIIIHPDIRPANAPMLWNTNLFNAHMKNYKYAIDKNFKFDYFCTLASNEMFVKNMDLNEVKNNLKLEKKDFNKKHSSVILDKLNTWTHYNPFMKNLDMCKFFMKNGLEPFAMYHEGLILPSWVMPEIYDLYKKDNFDQKISGLQDFLLEEVFIPTYLNNHYDYNNYSLTFRNCDSPVISGLEIFRSMDKFYSMKRIPRDFNHPTRKRIRNCYIERFDQLLNKENNNKDKKKFSFVGFYSEGEPYDLGYDLTHCKNELNFLIENYFDKVTFYCPRILREMGYEKYVKPYPHYGCVTGNPKLNFIGFCAWRPLLLLLELEKLEDGDILVYRDSNIGKYPELAYGYDKLKEYAENYLNLCKFDFFVFRENEEFKLKRHCKTKVIRELGNDDRFVYEFPLIMSGNIIVRKSKVSIELITEWLHACEKEEWITGDYNEDPHPEFRWFTPEQGILGVIIAKWVKEGRHGIPINYPGVLCGSRDIRIYSIPVNYEYLGLI